MYEGEMKWDAQKKATMERPPGTVSVRTWVGKHTLRIQHQESSTEEAK